MTRLSETQLGADWLVRFASSAERESAEALMDEILLVSRDTLINSLRSLVDALLLDREDSERPIGLFAERAVPKLNGKVLPLYPGSDAGRATGPGINPIVINPADQEIGSEALIGNLITDLQRHQDGAVLSHPGPDRMRVTRVRDIAIVTDFIGSGKRIWEMLEAFRAVATLRSWRSYGLIRFHVLAYSGTEEGLRQVRSSRLKPKIVTVAGCPTLYNTFTGVRLSDILKLCRRYPHGHRYPTGFGYSGVLIAFAHGMPNNAPPILHSRKNGWVPLFRGRSTAGAKVSFPSNAAKTLADRAARLLRIHVAHEHLVDPTGRRWITSMMVLTALQMGARTPATVSARSGLSLAQTEDILGFSRVARWTTERNVLTPLGRQELARLRRRRRRIPVLPSTQSPFYYPTQLRAR
jgi:hypothetical protein